MRPWDPIQTIVDDVRHRKTTASKLVDQAMAAIDSNESYQAIISTTEKRAKERAKVIDQQITEGKEAGRLAGVPFIAKDNFLTFGGETTAASNILKGFQAPYQATAIERLEAEGAICVAKANLDAFAHGSSTENSDWFVTKNPHNTEYVPGGSSGGSAAAVMLDMAPFALGTDTGGSIRLPAAFCGAVGLKPTYGLVSRSGVIAMASSTDVIGPITRTVQDAGLVLDVMAGRDQLDSTTIDREKVSYIPADIDIKGKKIGIIAEHIGEGVNPEVLTKLDVVRQKLVEKGAQLQEISLPSLDLALACYYIICPAEISSNLSRYDGQRYGYSNPDATTLDESYQLSRSTGFGDEAKRRIMIGTYVLSTGYYEAYYKRAQQVRTKLIEEFKQAFDDCDFLIGPTAPSTAFKIGENTSEPLQMYLADSMTVGVNLVGAPAISLPAGVSSEKLPIGIQLIAPQRQDKALLDFANKIEELL